MDTHFFAVLVDPKLLNIVACLLAVGILRRVLTRTSTEGHRH